MRFDKAMSRNGVAFFGLPRDQRTLDCHVPGQGLSGEKLTKYRFLYFLFYINNRQASRLVSVMGAGLKFPYESRSR